MVLEYDFSNSWLVVPLSIFKSHMIGAAQEKARTPIFFSLSFLLFLGGFISFNVIFVWYLAVEGLVFSMKYVFSCTTLGYDLHTTLTSYLLQVFNKVNWTPLLGKVWMEVSGSHLNLVSNQLLFNVSIMPPPWSFIFSFEWRLWPFMSFQIHVSTIWDE